MLITGPLYFVCVRREFASVSPRRFRNRHGQWALSVSCRFWVVVVVVV